MTVGKVWHRIAAVWRAVAGFCNMLMERGDGEVGTGEGEERQPGGGESQSEAGEEGEESQSEGHVDDADMRNWLIEQFNQSQRSVLGAIGEILERVDIFYFIYT